MADNTVLWVVLGVVVLFAICWCCNDRRGSGCCGKRDRRRRKGRRHSKSSSSDSDCDRRRSKKKCGKCGKKSHRCKCKKVCKKPKLKLEPPCVSGISIQTKTLVNTAPVSTTVAAFVPGYISSVPEDFNPSTTLITSAVTGQTVSPAIFSLAGGDCCSPLCKSIRPRIVCTGTSTGLYSGITVCEACKVWVTVSATARVVFSEEVLDADWLFGQIVFTPTNPSCGTSVVVAGLNPVAATVGTTDPANIDFIFSITPLNYLVCQPGTFEIRIARSRSATTDVEDFFAVLREQSVFTVNKIPELCWVKPICKPKCDPCDSCNSDPCCCPTKCDPCNTCYQYPCCC